MSRPADAYDPRTLRTYFEDVSEHKVLDRETEQRLAKQCRRGGRRGMHAQAALARANLRYVMKVARGFQGRGLSLPDLIQEGNAGLVRAIKTFDPGRNTRLVTYADNWIRAFIRRAIADQGMTVRLTAPLAGKLPAAKRALWTLEAKLGRPPTDEELAAEIGVNAEKARYIRRAIEQPTISLDADRETEEGTTRLGNYLANRGLSQEEELAVYERRLRVREKVIASWPHFDRRERRILVLRIMADEPVTLSDLARRFDLSRERVRQIEARLKKRLRHLLRHIDR